MTSGGSGFSHSPGAPVGAAAYRGRMAGVESDASRRARETEPVTVELERKALFAARAAARAKGLSLSEWLSRVAWEQAVTEAAETSAGQCRLHPDEPPGWEDAALDRIFGQDAA
jgi:hypothetical protein